MFPTTCFTVIVIAFVAAPSIYCFALFCQCRLAVCIVNPIQVLSLTVLVLRDENKVSAGANANANNKMTLIIFCGMTPHAFTVLVFGDDKASADADTIADNKMTLILFVAGPPCFHCFCFWR